MTNSQMPEREEAAAASTAQSSARRAKRDDVNSEIGSQGSHGNGERSSRAPTGIFLTEVASAFLMSNPV
jgi:hypothetical protein